MPLLISKALSADIFICTLFNQHHKARVLKKLKITFCVALICWSCIQTAFAQSSPKLVVGITIDQMRWDILNRYKHRWHSLGGFNRVLQNGFNCQNTYIHYLPSYTACGHASIYTGTVPAVHGITGNSWWDNTLQEYVYCSEDDSVKTVGSKTDLGQMSPVNLLTTTICDQLKIATNNKNKTIGIALKDRGGIIPAGHSADAAYWYDNEEGKWITSTYYMIAIYTTSLRILSFDLRSLLLLRA